MAVQVPKNYGSSLSTNKAFLDNLRVDNEPVGLLGRYFAQIAEVATKIGIGLSVEPITQLAQINAANRESWRPLVPALDPDVNDLDENNSFCLIAYAEDGEPVASGGCRLYNWEVTSYFRELESLRMFYASPAQSASSCEMCTVSAQGAKAVTGRVVYAGAAWCHPKVRGNSLSSIIPRTGKAMALAKWDFDYMVGLMLEETMQRGLAQRFGYTDPQMGARIVDKSGTARDFAVLSMPRASVIEHVRRYSAGEGPEVDSVIGRRLA